MLLSSVTDFTVSKLIEESNEKRYEEDGRWPFFLKGMIWDWVFVVL